MLHVIIVYQSDICMQKMYIILLYVPFDYMAQMCSYYALLIKFAL